MLRLKRLSVLSAPPEKSYGIASFSGGLNMDEDELLLPPCESPNAYNVDFISGSLCRSGGYSNSKWRNPLSTEAVMYTTQTDVPLERLFIFRSQDGNSASENILAQLSDYSVIKYHPVPEYGIIPYNILEADGTLPQKKVTYLLNYRSENEDCAILGGPEWGTYTYKKNDMLRSVSGTTPWLTKAVMHYDRMFGVGEYSHPKRIWFSAQGNPANFNVNLNEGGYIDIMGDKGKARNIIAFADSVFVFWQYGITRLSAYNLQSEFNVTEIYTCSSEILPDSVCVCGNQLIFATREGVYSCNGASVHCISTKIRKLFDNNSVPVGGECAVYHRGRYYLSLRLPLEDGSLPGNNAMLEFDLLRDKWRIFKGCNIRQLCITHDWADEKLLMLCENDVRIYCWDGNDTYNGSPIESRWDSPLTSLGEPDAVKELKELHVTVSGVGNLYITLRADGKEQTKKIALTAQKKIKKLRYSLRGKLISLSITNEGGNYFELACPLMIYTTERA